jgi:hypothetical protein
VLATLGLLLAAFVAGSFGLGANQSTPSALVPALWSDTPNAQPPATSAERTRATQAIIRRSQQSGVLRGILGGRAPRVVQMGALQSGGRTVGTTALLALPVARHNVRAVVPVDARSTAGLSVRHARFSSAVVRDLLVDVDLGRGAVVGVEPGPASAVPSWSGGSPPSTAATVAPAPGAPARVRLSPQGPSFAPYDGGAAPRTGARDWPVTLVFAGHATVGKVKRAMRTVGFTRTGERRWLAYGAAGPAAHQDGDRGLKTANDANGADVHMRFYAPPGANHFSDPKFGSVVLATAHLDHGEGSTAPLYGFTEVAQRRAASTIAHRLGWRVQRDAVALGNAQPYRRDLAAPQHVWWSDGRATLITVP